MTSTIKAFRFYARLHKIFRKWLDPDVMTEDKSLTSTSWKTVTDHPNNPKIPTLGDNYTSLALKFHCLNQNLFCVPMATVSCKAHYLTADTKPQQDLPFLWKQNRITSLPSQAGRTTSFYFFFAYKASIYSKYQENNYKIMTCGYRTPYDVAKLQSNKCC